MYVCVGAEEEDEEELDSSMLLTSFDTHETVTAKVDSEKKVAKSHQTSPYKLNAVKESQAKLEWSPMLRNRVSFYTNLLGGIATYGCIMCVAIWCLKVKMNYL